MISAGAIEKLIDSLKQNRFRSSTLANYYVIWKKFNEFIIKLDKKPTNWESRITLYAGYLVNNGKKSTTINSYVSAIKGFLLINNIKIKEDRYLLTSLTKACKLVNDKVRTRLPIRKGLLQVLINNVRKYFMKRGQKYLSVLYPAMFATAYYGLLRVGEVSTGSHPVLVDDVHVAINKRKFCWYSEHQRLTGLILNHKWSQ